MRPALKAVVDVDAKAEKGVFLAPTTLPSKRVVFSSTGPLDRDYDDVRRSVSCQSTNNCNLAKCLITLPYQ